MKQRVSPSTLYSLATNTPSVGQYIPFSPRPSITLDPSSSPGLMIHSEAAFTFLNSETQKPSPLSLPSALMSKDLSPLLSPQHQKTAHSQILPDIQFATLNLFSARIHITSFMTEESKALEPYLPSKSFSNDTQCLSLSAPPSPKALPAQSSAEHKPLPSSDTVTLYQSDFSVGRCLMKGAERSPHKNTNPGSVLYPPPSASRGLHPPSSAANECSSHSSETSYTESPFLGSEEITLTDTDHGSTSFKSAEDEDRLPSSLLSLKLPALACDSHNQQDSLVDPVDAILPKNAEPPHKQAPEPSQNGTTNLTPAPPIQNCTLLDVDNIQRWNMNQAMVNGGSVYTSDKDSAGLSSKEACIQAETDHKPLIYSVYDSHSSKTEPQKHQEHRHSGSLSKQKKLSIRDLAACEQQVQHKTEIKPHKLTTDSLGVVQETSVDVSDGENEDVDFFQQLNAESKVYWAEPIQITILAEESNTFQDSHAVVLSEDTVSLSLLPPPATSGTNQISGKADIHSDPCSSTPNSCSSLCASTEKSHNPSVSGQASSSLSSHIVQRKDVPLWTESKHTNFPSAQTLDTSTPLRALQSWKNLQIQRHALTCKLSQRYFNTLSRDDSQMCIRTQQRPSKGFPSTTSFPLLCTDSTFCNPTPVMLRSDRASEDQHTKSLEWMNTLGPGSGGDEQPEVGRNESQGPDTLGGKAIPQCCCSCHHPQNCCGRKYSHPQHISVSNATLSRLFLSMDADKLTETFSVLIFFFNLMFFS